MDIVEKTYDIKGACGLIGCSESSLRRMVRDGEIPYYKVKSRIRFSDKALTKWIQSQEKRNSHFRA